MVSADGRQPAALWPVAALLFNALTWGVSWWPFRHLHAQGLHPLWLTALCFSISVALLLVFRPAALGMVLRRPTLWVLVLAAGTTNASFNWAVTVGDVVRVVLLFYLMPLWTVLLSRALLGERISARGALRVLLALLGAAVVLWPTGDQPASGILLAGLGLADALAVVGGFSFALNNVMLRREAGQDPAARALAMFGGGALVAGALALGLSHTGAVPPIPTMALPWLLGTLGMAFWFLASNLALQYGAARLPANTTAVVLVSEVLFASLSAAALGAGLLDGRVVLGGLLIVSSALLATLQRD